jgi:hypothetical protein
MDASPKQGCEYPMGPAGGAAHTEGSFGERGPRPSLPRLPQDGAARARRRRITSLAVRHFGEHRLQSKPPIPPIPVSHRSQTWWLLLPADPPAHGDIIAPRSGRVEVDCPFPALRIASHRRPGCRCRRSDRHSHRTSAGSMIGATRRWLRRNRTNFAVGAGVLGAGYLAGQYALGKLSEARQRMSDDRIAKEK